jgi:hypothetical protein
MGANGSCGASYLCTAMRGYDGPSGLGTPNGSGAFQSLREPRARNLPTKALVQPGAFGLRTRTSRRCG